MCSIIAEGNFGASEKDSTHILNVKHKRSFAHSYAAMPSMISMTVLSWPAFECVKARRIWNLSNAKFPFGRSNFRCLQVRVMVLRLDNGDGQVTGTPVIGGWGYVTMGAVHSHAYLTSVGWG